MTHVAPPSNDHKAAPSGGNRGGRVYRTVFDELQHRIRGGEWLPGARLPSITRLAEEFSVGTGSIREALQSLQSIGLVRIEHGRGIFITGSRPATELASHFQDTGTMLMLAETRRILEPEVAALAAERGTDAQLTEIWELAVRMEDAARQGLDFAELDVQFHLKIAQASCNPVLSRMMQSINDLLLDNRRQIIMEPDLTVRTVRYHVMIAELLRERNASQARLLMLAHMHDAVNSVLATEAMRTSKQKPTE
ncbi:MAG: FadR/GntR family transcriptional regulator [Anaerolineales bacterium]